MEGLVIFPFYIESKRLDREYYFLDLKIKPYYYNSRAFFVVYLKKHIIAMITSKLKLTPSTRRIYRLTKEHLLTHYSLIANKASSLSSAQRNVVEIRVGYMLQKGLLTELEIQEYITKLNEFVIDNIKETLNKKINDSSTKE